MKKVIFILICLLGFVPIIAKADGVSVSSNSITVYLNDSKVVVVSVTNAAASVSVSSDNTSIATVSKAYISLTSNGPGTVTDSILITGKSLGETYITVYNDDVSTFDNVSLDGKSLKIKVNVVEKPTTTTTTTTRAIPTTTTSIATTQAVITQSQIENKTTTTKKTTTTTTKVVGTETVTEPITEVQATEEITTEIPVITTTQEIKERIEKVSKPKIKYLKIAGYDIDFDKDVYEYQITLDKNVKEIYVYAKAENDDFKISGSDIINIESLSTVKVTVLDEENNLENVYKIKLKRKNPFKEKMIIIFSIIFVECFGVYVYTFIKNKKNAGIIKNI